MALLSLAQTLPPELLTQIFGWLIEGSQKRNAMDRSVGGLVKFPISSCSDDIRTVALVCRKWRSPAQRALFRFIDFSCSDLDKLAAVVTQKSNLAAEVHAVCAGLVGEMGTDYFPKSRSRQYKTEGETACRILAACGNIKHVDLRGFMRELHMRLLGILDSLDLESLTLSQGWWLWNETWRARLWFPSPNDITVLAQKPSLRILDLRLWTDPARHGTTLPPRPINPTSFVTALSLALHDATLALRMLHEVADTLVILEIFLMCRSQDDGTTSVLATLRKLERLVLKGVYLTSYEWLAPALPHLPVLRHLACDVMMGVVALQSPPPSLTHLACIFLPLQRPHVPLRAMVRAAGMQTSRLQYKSVSINIAHEGWDQDAFELLQELTKLLKIRGVELEIPSRFVEEERNARRYLWFS
ncbi:Proteophosphoglycan 5 [Rhodotorula toruloides]